MKNTPVVLMLAGVVVLVLTAASRLSAQFETPNRSFHNATHFPLTGKHLAVTCEACHLNGQFRGTPRQCYDCHWIRRKDDRYQTRLGTHCDQCHQPTAWTAVRFDHASLAGVALNADHRLLQCEACHRNANFRAGSASCISCHQTDYNATKNPNHIAAGFPTTCDVCHRPSDVSWTQGVFNHTRFPLTGPHNASCAQCHTTGSFQIFSCITCHTRTQTDSAHRGRPGYVYDSNACYACHPNGRAG